MFFKSISLHNRNQRIITLTREYNIPIIINLIFIIIGILDIKHYLIAINLSRMTLLWIFLYTISHNFELEDMNFSKMIAMSNIILIVMCGLSLIEICEFKIHTCLFSITFMNVCNFLYFQYEQKNKQILRDSMIFYFITILVLYLLYQKVGADNIIYILAIFNIIMASYNLFFYNEKRLPHYKIIKNLSVYNFIISITIIVIIFYKDIFDMKFLGDLLLLLFFNHTYCGYKYTIKKVVNNPYFELKSKNEKLNFNSQQLNKLNEIINKEISIKNQIKKYITQRKELLNQSLDNVPSMWIIIDCNLNIIYKNNEFMKVLGTGVRSFTEILNLIAKTDEEILYYLECLEDKKNIDDKIVFLSKIPYLLNIKYNDFDDTYLISLNDIEHEFNMEKELKDKKDEYENIVNNIPCPIMIRNVESNLDQTKIISINKAFENLFGYRADEVENINSIDYYKKFNIDFFDSKRYRKLDMPIEEKIRLIDNESHSNYIMNCIMTDKNKNKHNLEVNIENYQENLNSNKLKLLTFTDKTEEVSIYQQIQKQNQVYCKILNSIPEGIIVKSLDDDGIVYANKKFKKIFKIQDRVKKTLIRKYNDRLETKYLYNLNNNDLNKTIYMVNEEKVIKELKVRAHTWKIENSKYRVKIVEDLAQQRQYEKMRTILMEQRKYDKLKMEFYANISHELKTPLNNIYSSTQLIENFNKNNKIKDTNGQLSYHVKIVKQNMFRLMRLIDNIINIAQVKSEVYKLKSVNFDIVYLVEEIVMSINSYAQSRNLNLIFDTNEEYLLVGLDPEAIERIVLNLLSNAIKFTETKGEILVGVYKIKNKVQIKVTDNGVGIDEDKLTDIFDRFKQIENGKINNEFGSGIGLYLSKSLVKIQDGTINIKSKINVGTEVTIEFPIKEVIEEDEDIIEYGGNIEKFKIEFFDIYK
ncbi:PAS domain-containing sensor histidine kinase [Romboutsia sedimentorum]|uniref:histidine kinase n=1 Tax=Romboutsia sedimentorum TaxID=1368474 RepID=A0ABT7EAJ5_9FIRM|nr:PAS domain-containing sensor histidine kinase [Romboutsia sedimentorum]MDK2563949.1 PAS domain-containing sensor histidine kinase [Romboutsia sedimentorum]